MGMGFAPTWLRQVSPMLHKTTLTTDYKLHTTASTKTAATVRTCLSLTWNVHRFRNRNWIAQIQVTVTEVHDSSKSINIRQIYWRNRIFRYVSMDHSERIANGSVLRRTTLLTLSHKVRFENVSTESVVLKLCLVESHLDTRRLVVQRNWKKKQ